ncbi:hypothetical protein MTR_4g067280 [Medicago truncatula]|uniref:Uncharacterized protein n=1 Tax=Medicago truncatula TaxID=3880 RepID=A0A072ULT0_MEDTR|nr:hypothetical protein MTR_4g067280 [Medicago truncatula]
MKYFDAFLSFCTQSSSNDTESRQILGKSGEIPNGVLANREERIFNFFDHSLEPKTVTASELLEMSSILYKSNNI